MILIGKKSVYIGGEKDTQDIIIPKYYEDFFKESLLFFCNWINMFVIDIVICLNRFYALDSLPDSTGEGGREDGTGGK